MKKNSVLLIVLLLPFLLISCVNYGHQNIRTVGLSCSAPFSENSIGCFDYFVFSQFWNPSILKSNEPSIKAALKEDAGALIVENKWIPHGLWPNAFKKDGGVVFLEFCSNKPLNIENFPASFRKKMREFYINVTRNLYVHEWEKHGSCVERSGQNYFKKIFNIQSRFQNDAFLRKNAGKWVLYQDLEQALISHKSSMSLICEIRNHRQFFSQRRIGLDKKLHFFPLPKTKKQSGILIDCLEDQKIYIESAEL